MLLASICALALAAGNAPPAAAQPRQDPAITSESQAPAGAAQPTTAPEDLNVESHAAASDAAEDGAAGHSLSGSDDSPCAVQENACEKPCAKMSAGDELTCKAHCGKELLKCHNRQTRK